MNYSKYLIIKTILLIISFLGTLFSSELQSFKERPLVVVVCSYNNIKWVEKNLDSIFLQRYSNYRLIYVDDGSTDGTGDFVAHYIKEHALEDKVVFIRNEQRLRKLANVYRAIHLCKDNEIVVMVDGDDWLAHRGVFKFINREYNDKNVWFTYGQYRNEPAREAERWGFSSKGYCRPIPSRIQTRKIYRRRHFVYMHLRTFYAWLFKLIKLEDLIADRVKGFRGDFYPASNDLAIFFPIVEMAHKRVKFIPQILYIRNLYSDIVGFKVDRKLQGSSGREIKKKNVYRERAKPFKNRLHKYKKSQADLFLFCQRNGNSIADAVHSIHNNISGINSVYVFYLGTAENNLIVEDLKKMFPSVQFISYDLYNAKLKKNVMKKLRDSECGHILLTTDMVHIKSTVDIQKLISCLEKTFAHGFYLDRSEQDNFVPRHVQLGDGICAWKFGLGKSKWERMYDLDFSLYRKIDLKRRLEKCEFNTINCLKQQLKLLETNKKKIGLFYKEVQVIFE